MEKRLQEVYDQVRMSEACSCRIEQAMRAKGAEGQKYVTGYRWKPGLVAALAAVMLLALADTTVYAYTGSGLLSRVMSWAGNAIFTQGTDAEGNAVGTASLDTLNMTAPAVYRDGHLWFTANGENIDITDEVSETRAYVYDYTDGEGIRHYLIVGGAPETFGYAEFLYDATKDPGWIGGYFTSGKVGETINPDWLEKAKEELGIPWP